MKEDYLKAFSEVEQIIKLMPESLQKKIPNRFINIISTEKSQAYTPNIKEPFEECNIMEETKIILAVIYRDFLCSEEEKKEIKLKDSQKLIEYEEELRERYNTDNIFKNRINTSNNLSIEKNECTAIVEVKDKSFLRRIFEKIKNLFNRK